MGTMDNAIRDNAIRLPARVGNHVSEVRPSQDECRQRQGHGLSLAEFIGLIKVQRADQASQQPGNSRSEPSWLFIDYKMA
jgi:hypothetical protein